jgi:hypothetical protein
MTKEGLKRRKYRHEHNALNGKNNPLYKAIRKYGKANIKWDILVNNIKTKEDACKIEIYCIAVFNTLSKGYNCTKGGEGYDPKTRPKCKDCNVEVRNWNAVRCLKCFKVYQKSDQFKNKISKIQKQSFKDDPNRRIQCSKAVGTGKIIRAIKDDSIVFESFILKDVALFLNLSEGMIWRCLKGKLKSYKGYRFKYVN